MHFHRDLKPWLAIQFFQFQNYEFARVLDCFWAFLFGWGGGGKGHSRKNRCCRRVSRKFSRNDFDHLAIERTGSSRGKQGGQKAPDGCSSISCHYDMLNSFAWGSFMHSKHINNSIASLLGLESEE